MTEQQLKVLNELVADPDFKGKETLKHLIWRNTAVPKYGVGESFYVSDRSRRIFGVTAIDFKATVAKVKTIASEEEYMYELDAIVTREKDGKVLETKFYARESELTKKAEDNLNTV